MHNMMFCAFLNFYLFFVGYLDLAGLEYSEIFLHPNDIHLGL